MFKSYRAGSLNIKWVIILFVLSGNMHMFQEELTGQASNDLKAIVSGALGCSNTSVELSCNIDKQGATYKWKGPNGFYSTSKKPRTALQGEYTVSVFDPYSGAVASSSVTVLSDFTPPRDVTILKPGVLNCIDTLISVEGKSATKKAIYEWKGPNGFTSSEALAKVSEPGVYNLKVINPVNGCFENKHINVIQDIKSPGISAKVSGELNCINKSVKLAGSAEVPNVAYLWKGPDNIVSSNADLSVSQPGLYQLKVTNSKNGCTEETELDIVRNVMVPSDLEVYVSDTLSCKTNMVSLNFKTVEKGLTCRWTGPDGFESTGKEVQAFVAGTYNLEVLNPKNGCTVSKNTEVVQDVKPPEDLLLNAGVLSCKDSIVSIKPGRGYSNLSFSWSGPNNYKSKEPVPTVSKAGEYVAKIINRKNGCKATKSIIIKENTQKPTGIRAMVSGEITCSKKEVQLKAGGKNPNVEYNWTGPGGFKSTQRNPQVSLAGDYKLSVVDLKNGCQSQSLVKVINRCTD